MSDFSRVNRLGAAAAGIPEADLEQRLEAGGVHVTVDARLPGALLAARVLLTTLRRMPGRLSLDPAGIPRSTVAKFAAAVDAIDPTRGLRVDAAIPKSVCQVHVGTTTSSPNAIRVVPDGYGAHVARAADVVITQSRPAHPLGSVQAAAFGAAEAFKDNARVLPNRRQDHDHLSWCPVALSHDLELAPIVAGTMWLDLALAGCGAVGTANALILAELDATGNILALDRQEVGPENVATYSLGGRDDGENRRRKVDLVASALSRYHVVTRHGDLEELVGAVDDGEVLWPGVVLSGLDSVPARHAVQRLWPDRLIDVGTGDTAVGLHEVVAEKGPCLMCFFPTGGDVSAVVRLSEITGLTVEFLGRGHETLLAEHIAHLDEDKRNLLAPHVGKQVCSLAEAAGLVEGGGAYQPAVPFVALQAACLGVGRLIAIEAEMPGLPNFVQYDTLMGPRPDASDDRGPARGCYCQANAELISRVRASREQRRARGTHGVTG